MSVSTCFWRSVSSVSDARASSTGECSRGSRIPARTYSASAEIRRPVAIWARISADGLRSPRSIWLRYGLLIPATFAS